MILFIKQMEMEGWRYMKKNFKEFWDNFKSILVVFIGISIFWGGYFVFFYMAGHPIEGKN